MTRVLFHIGYPKTGTTTVQSFLASNRKRLAAGGVLFPEVPGRRNHTRLLAYALDADKEARIRLRENIRNRSDVLEFRARMRNALRDEIAGSGCNTVVLSNEHCGGWLRSPEEVGRIADLLAPVSSQIEILVYVRRQDQFLTSSYATAVRNGQEDPLTVPGPDEERFQKLLYFERLEPWARVFGTEAIRVRPFDRQFLEGGDVVHDIAGVLGCTLTDAWVMPSPKNTSIDYASLEFLRAMNSRVPVRSANGLNPLRGDLAPLVAKHAGRGGVSLPAAERRRLLELVLPSNDKLFATYLPGMTMPWHPDQLAPTDDAQTAAEPAWHQAVELAASLWNEKSRELLRARVELCEALVQSSGEGALDRLGLRRPIEEVGHLLTEAPESGALHYLMGMLLFREGRHRAAMAELQKAVDLEPLQQAYRAAMLRCLCEQDGREAALRYLAGIPAAVRESEFLRAALQDMALPVS